MKIISNELISREDIIKIIKNNNEILYICLNNNYAFDNYIDIIYNSVLAALNNSNSRSLCLLFYDMFDPLNNNNIPLFIEIFTNIIKNRPIMDMFDWSRTIQGSSYWRTLDIRYSIFKNNQ